MNRRTFIKGFIGLAACAVTEVNGLHIPLIETDRDKFVRMCKTGLIENQIFNIDGGVVLRDMGNLTIRNCVFNFTSQPNVALTIGEGCEYLTVTGCHFNGLAEKV